MGELYEPKAPVPKMAFTPEESIQYAKEGRLDEWVDAFLRSGENKNIEMADGLRKAKRYWVGPVELSLKNLKRVCGPEDGMEYKESQENWDARVNGIIEHVQQDGVLPPFIAQYMNGDLKLADGNHRQGAYEKMGAEKHWTIIWCDSEQEVSELKTRYGI